MVVAQTQNQRMFFNISDAKVNRNLYLVQYITISDIELIQITSK